MSNSYTPNAGFLKPAAGDRNWNTAVDANFKSLDGMTAVGSFCATAGSGLTLNVSAGSYALADDSVAVFAGGSVVLPTGSTTCVWLDGLGVLTTGAAFPTSPHLRICVATTDASSITAIADARIVHRLTGV